MGIVRFEISQSLDGFIAGVDDTPELGLGVGGEQLHEWVVKERSWREAHGYEGGEETRDGELLEESMGETGAVVVGKRMFVLAHEWGDEPPFKMPVFVVTHEDRETDTRGETTFRFVEGVENAVEQARAAAGDKNVAIGGGADVARQAIRAGLVDEIDLHVVPLLLGRGRRLFDDWDGGQIELEPIRVIDSPAVTHVRYRVKR
jgi:dihydrofolate reductase